MSIARLKCSTELTGSFRFLRDPSQDIVGIGIGLIDRQRVLQAPLGFAVLLLLVQRKSQTDTGVDVVGIHLYRAAVASGGVRESVGLQMLITLPLVQG